MELGVLRCPVRTMLYYLLADLVLVLHLLFIVFVVAGGLMVLRWPRAAWLHVPCAAWGAAVELAGWICPLTPVEQYFRRRSGEVGFTGGFIEEYLLPLIYPGELTREIQIALGVGVLVLNLGVYGWVVARRLRGRRAEG